jgi:glycine cleavage system aminomethyltransferase T
VVVGCPVGFAYIDDDRMQLGAEVTVRLLGDWYPATIRKVLNQIHTA